VALIVDQGVAGADMYGGVNVLAPGHEIPMHWHLVSELQYVVAGTGVALNALGAELELTPHATVFSPAGREGAHGFRNTGKVPLHILFFYPSDGGVAPALHLVNPVPGSRDRPGPDRAANPVEKG
jgi:gentisate 1,2-dioxygenase